MSFYFPLTQKKMQPDPYFFTVILMFYDFQLPNQVYMTVSRPGKRILKFHDYKAVMGN